MLDTPPPFSPPAVLLKTYHSFHSFLKDTSSLEVLKVPNLDNGGPNFFDITLFARDYENSPGDLVHVYVNVDPVEEFDPEFDKNSYTAQVF